MSLEDFKVAPRPKVQGTQKLDELFHSTPLDSFGFLYLLLIADLRNGQSGPTQLAAANMYMHSHDEERLKKFGYLRMSEPEFHGVFAEAIVAGQPISKEDPETITSIGDEPNAP
ncbi:uncharacterized protein TRIVIDRAFT_226303 [Trichoderma virens Gv29-8]|uniref:Uncharacterized protein n=1 Tax=Hypocrea virens (strain Gv29-8 / FGSC 10586) TaxID=413071 RepID=G9N601_HYPVG|nr:uncharacterized protein TRIVIDRAFT_226303 [Trichoderma virens Gv29-8]EHK18192.1 hypothetical protein TRIVIDRAFT_226303 [Trichoderma virens Gv29-8]UKZ53937.1 hypothetical protein TrVGV298_007740 [Trichoderma virens]